MMDDFKVLMQRSSLLYSKEQIELTIHRLAQDINHNILSTDVPVFFTVMNGGMFFAARLLQYITHPCLTSYIHASRYYGTSGQDITWHYKPPIDMVHNKHVYIIDDVLDEGYTLLAISELMHSMGALSCNLIVLLEKMLDTKKPIAAQYVGFNAPNKFLFGYGMDINSAYRNLEEIYCINN
jgi:hypoxanthine phosphoribosyltransferase